jgi:hypothetical protein
MSEMRDLDGSVSVLYGGVANWHCLPDVFGHLRGVLRRMNGGWRFVSVRLVLQVMARLLIVAARAQAPTRLRGWSPASGMETGYR